MTVAEREARGEGKTLLVLDAVTGDSSLYAQLGRTMVGVIPGYALYPDGRPCDTPSSGRRSTLTPHPHTTPAAISASPDDERGASRRHFGDLICYYST